MPTKLNFNEFSDDDFLIDTWAMIELTKLSRSSIVRARKAGALTFHKFGRAVRFSIGDAREWISKMGGLK